MTAPPARPHILPRPSTQFSWIRPSNAQTPVDSAGWGWTDDLDDDTWDSTSDNEDSPKPGRHGKQGSSNRIGSGLKVNNEKEVISPPSSRVITPTSQSSTLPSVSTSSPIPVTNGYRSAHSRIDSGLSSSGIENLGGRADGHGGVLDQTSTSSNSGGNVSFSFTHLDAPSPSSYPARESILASPPAPPDTLSEEARRAAGWTIVSKDESTAKALALARRREKSQQHGASVESIGEEPDVHLQDEDTPEAEGDSGMVVGELELEEPAPHKRVKVGPEAITLYVEDIVKDPLFPVRRAHEVRPSTSSANMESGISTALSRGDSALSKLAQQKEQQDRKREKIEDCLIKEDVDIAQLRTLSWSGIPSTLRHVVWPILLGYIPLSSSARLPALQRKRQEFTTLVDLTFSKGKEGLDQLIWHQIEIDVPRTRPGVKLWMQDGTQRSLERILYVWAIRHPASGYVQGINDLVTPFYQIFLSAYIDSDPEEFDPGLLPPHVLNAVEADSFWCLSRLLDGIQDNYIQAQPGIQRSVKRMRDLVGRIDPPLAAHLDNEGVEFMQFAFRWMNCLLMREISVNNTIRMWDAYLSEGTDAFSQFHLYVCSAFLVQWSDQLRKMDFQGIIMFLQSLPTQDWSDHEIQMLLSSAFVLMNTWANAQNHFS
ncbi:GTPase-activating protein [Tulasnella sp. JGI-2019a]|nr:GTPase-activating protein [Tulasnella sp. JGI-2019a]KAG9010243.1 GTPase-activating protein [Tulasnella sp. JGI-2019a]